MKAGETVKSSNKIVSIVGFYLAKMMVKASTHDDLRVLPSKFGLSFK